MEYGLVRETTILTTQSRTSIECAQPWRVHVRTLRMARRCWFVSFSIEAVSCPMVLLCVAQSTKNGLL